MTDVAIIGLGCVLPKAPDVLAFWRAAGPEKSAAARWIHSPSGLYNIALRYTMRTSAANSCTVSSMTSGLPSAESFNRRDNLRPSCLEHNVRNGSKLGHERRRAKAGSATG